MGCGTNGSDAHDVIACGSGWAAIGFPNLVDCDKACDEPPSNFEQQGALCTVGAAGQMCTYFEYDGVKGCCLPTNPTTATADTFAECEAQ